MVGVGVLGVGRSQHHSLHCEAHGPARAPGGGVLLPHGHPRPDPGVSAGLLVLFPPPHCISRLTSLCLDFPVVYDFKMIQTVYDPF